MVLPLSAILWLLAMTLVALKWLGAVVAVRRTHRACQWRDDRRLLGPQPDWTALRPAGLRRVTLRQRHAEPLSHLLDRHADILDWRPYDRTDPQRASRALRRTNVRVVLLMAGFSLGMLSLALTPFKSVALLLGGILFGALSLVVRRAYIEHAPERARTRLDALRADRRATALLLRPFGLEGQAFAPQRPFGLMALPPTPVEEAMARAVGRAMPALAVGRPGDDLPRGHAVRLYASELGWQPLVSELIGRSDWLLVRAGASDGIRWEVEEIRRQGRLCDCVIALVDWEGYPFGQERYAQFADAFAGWTGIALPERGWNSWLLWFDRQCRPRLSGSRRPWRGEHEFVPLLRRVLVNR